MCLVFDVVSARCQQFLTMSGVICSSVWASVAAGMSLVTVVKLVAAAVVVVIIKYPVMSTVSSKEHAASSKATAYYYYYYSCCCCCCDDDDDDAGNDYCYLDDDFSKHPLVPSRALQARHASSCTTGEMEPGRGLADILYIYIFLLYHIIILYYIVLYYIIYYFGILYHIIKYFQVFGLRSRHTLWMHCAQLKRELGLEAPVL